MNEESALYQIDVANQLIKFDHIYTADVIKQLPFNCFNSLVIIYTHTHKNHSIVF